MYRIETDTTKRKAECCFNDEDYVNTLKKAFNSFFNGDTKDVGIEGLAYNQLNIVQSPSSIQTTH